MKMIESKFDEKLGGHVIRVGSRRESQARFHGKVKSFFVSRATMKALGGLNEVGALMLSGVKVGQPLN